jgi:hypothetical protein
MVVFTREQRLRHKSVTFLSVFVFILMVCVGRG